MSTMFRPYVPEQSLLLPPDVREWLPEGHLAHHISDLVDGLDLTAFYAPYEGDGRRNAPYEPRMMVKVLLYAYATGVFSSRGDREEAGRGRRVPGAGGRQLSRSTGRSASFDAGTWPISSGCSSRWSVWRGNWGLARFGKLSVDGTKGAGECEQAQGDELRSDAGGRTASWRTRSTRCCVRRTRPTWPRTCGWGRRSGGDELPAELRRREDRLAAIRAAKVAVGGGAASGGRRAGPAAGADPEPEGRPAVQASIWGA